MDFADWDAVLAVNLSAAFTLTRAAAAAMKRAGTGRIVNISSGAGLRASRTGIQAYTSAKHAMIGFTRQMAQEFGPHGVTVNAIAPGLFAVSAGTRKQWDGYGPEGQQRVIDGIALRRMGEAQDIANAVLFFASDLAGFVTGQVLPVNGGSLMGEQAMPARRTLLRLGGASLLATPAMSRAQSGPWPNRPIRVVVPFATGGGTDITMRMLAPKLGEILGQPIVVENRPGGGSTVGTDYVAKSPPDGYTFVLATLSSTGIAASLYANLPYDPAKDLVAVAPTVFIPIALAVTQRGWIIRTLEESSRR